MASLQQVMQAVHIVAHLDMVAVLLLQWLDLTLCHALLFALLMWQQVVVEQVCLQIMPPAQVQWTCLMRRSS